MNEQVVSLAFAPGKTAFSKKLYLDYSRHNGLYEYANMTLPAWVHLCLKKNFKPEEGLAILNFTLAPYHILGSNLE